MKSRAFIHKINELQACFTWTQGVNACYTLTQSIAIILAYSLLLSKLRSQTAELHKEFFLVEG